MEYEAFLINKKIDRDSFAKSEPEMFAKWKKEFSEMHPKSFEARKLFLINKIRRNHKLQSTEENTSKSVISPKPIIKPKIKR